MRVASLLAPGGFLFVELPNWNSAGRFLRRDHWSQLRPPEHINYFTPSSLRTLVEATGLKVTKSMSYYDARADLLKGSLRGLLAANTKQRAALAGAGGYVRLVAVKK